MSAGELMECCASISRLRTSTDARPVTTTCQCYLEWATSSRCSLNRLWKLSFYLVQRRDFLSG